MGITSTVAYYVTQGYPMRIWTHFLTFHTLLFFQGRHYVYFVYNCINITLYSNQSNPVNLLYFFRNYFDCVNLTKFYIKLNLVIIATCLKIKRL